MGVNYFIFNGESSLDHGCYVGGQGTYNAPQRDVTKTSIPGRNGDLIKDNGRWLNIEVPYNVVVMNDFRDRTDEIRAWLCEPIGYARLEDTYHPDFFRMARLSGNIEFETKSFNRTGRATVIFDCKPQRFLKSGEDAVRFTANGTIYNPTRYNSKPLIRILGATENSHLEVGQDWIEFEEASELYIDCETMDCYFNGESMNHLVTFSEYYDSVTDSMIQSGFPELKPGVNQISMSGITAVEIIGRWYTI